MFKSIINGQSKTITSAAIIIGATSLLSKVLGMVRDRILAGEFGAGATLDVYYAAFRIPDLIFNLLVLGALSAGFIPVFIMYYEKGREDGWRLASGILNIMTAILIAVGLIFVFFADKIIPWTVPGFSGEQLQITVALSRIMFLSPIFMGVSAVWGGILQSLKKFFVYSLAPIMYNIGIMIGALFLAPIFGIYGLAYGVVLGAGLHMLVQIPSVIGSGFHYHWHWSARERGVKKIFAMMVPRTLGLAISQVNLLVINIIASTLAVGSIAVFNLANNLQSFPLGVFGISFAIAAFPTLSSAMARDDEAGFVKSFSATTRQILFFILPLSVLFLVLRAQIVRSVLGAGVFSWNDTILTADTLAFFTVSLFAQALSALLARGFFSRHDSLTPFICGLVSAGVNISLALYLAPSMGVAGLALAFSVSSIINMALLWIFLRLKITGGLDEKNIIWSAFKISLATVGLGLTAQAMKYLVEPWLGTDTFVGIAGQGAIAGICGLAVFVGLSLLLRSQEMILFIESFRRKFLRQAKEAKALETESIEEEVK